MPAAVRRAIGFPAFVRTGAGQYRVASHCLRSPGRGVVRGAALGWVQGWAGDRDPGGQGEGDEKGQVEADLVGYQAALSWPWAGHARPQKTLLFRHGRPGRKRWWMDEVAIAYLSIHHLLGASPTVAGSAGCRSKRTRFGWVALPAVPTRRLGRRAVARRVRGGRSHGPVRLVIFGCSETRGRMSHDVPRGLTVALAITVARMCLVGQPGDQRPPLPDVPRESSRVRRGPEQRG